MSIIYKKFNYFEKNFKNSNFNYLMPFIIKKLQIFSFLYFFFENK